MTRILVETNDFRAGLISTVAHASNGKFYPELARVQLDVGVVNINITATDTQTVGWSIVSVESHLEPELETIDLSVSEVEKILAVFKKPARTKGDDPDHILCIETTDQEVTITDASGLFAGSESLTVLRLPSDEKFPNIPETFAHAQHSPLRSVDWILATDPMLRRFHAAAECYREPFTFESVRTTSSITVRCGDSFIGRMPQPRLADKTDELKRWRDGWDARIPTPAEVEAKRAEQESQL